MALMNIFAHYIFYAASGGEYNPKGFNYEATKYSDKNLSGEVYPIEECITPSSLFKH